MTLRKLFGFTTLVALLAAPLHVAAQGNVITAWNISLYSFERNQEKVVTTFGVPGVPPEQATAEGLASKRILALLIYDQDGNLLTDPSDPPTLPVPRGGFRTASISAACGADDCILMVDTGEGPRDLPGVVKPLHDRVIVRREVVCIAGPCEPGISEQVVVIDTNTGATREIIKRFLHRRNDLLLSEEPDRY